MYKTVAAVAVMLALTNFTSRACAGDEPRPLWEHQADLRLDAMPLKLEDQAARGQRLGWSDEWFFNTTPSLWFAAITGTAGPSNAKVDVDAGLDEIFDNGTLGLGFNFEAGVQRWSFLFTGMWMHLGDDASANSGGASADLDGDFGMIDLAVAYDFREWRVRGRQMLYLDGLLGLRWTKVSTKVNISGGVREDRDKDFVDPYIGLRARWYISNQFDLSATGTVGGAGVGSDLLATGEVLLEYRFSDSYSLVAGYRAYYYDYSDNFEWNVTMHGPVIGLTIRW